MLRREIGPGFHALPNRLDRRLSIVGVYQGHERLEGAAKRAGREAVLGFERLRPAHDAGHVVRVPDPDLRVLQGEAHPLLRRVERREGLIAFCDVPDHGEQVAVGHRRRDHVSGKDRSVLSPKYPLAMVVGCGIDRVERRRDVWDFGRRHDVGGLQSDQLLARVAEHPAHARIGIEIRAVWIGNQNAVRRVVEERAIASFARAHLSLGPFPIGDVPCKLRRADDHAGRVLDRRRRDRDLQQTPGLGPSHGLEIIHALAAPNPAQDLVLLVLAIVWNQPLDGGPHHLLGRVSENAFGTSVPGFDDAVQIPADDGVVRRFDNRRQSTRGIHLVDEFVPRRVHVSPSCARPRPDSEGWSGDRSVSRTELPPSPYRPLGRGAAAGWRLSGGQRQIIDADHGAIGEEHGSLQHVL